jgi:hypothetical protein
MEAGRHALRYISRSKEHLYVGSSHPQIDEMFDVVVSQRDGFIAQ